MREIDAERVEITFESQGAPVVDKETGKRLVVIMGRSETRVFGFERARLGAAAIKNGSTILERPPLIPPLDQNEMPAPADELLMPPKVVVPESLVVPNDEIRELEGLHRDNPNIPPLGVRRNLNNIPNALSNGGLSTPGAISLIFTL